MTTKSAYQRQPTKLDYASPTQFKFNIIINNLIISKDALAEVEKKLI